MNDIKEERKSIDTFEKIGKGSLIQYGEANNRIYLMKLNPYDALDIVSMLEKRAAKSNYQKIIVKIPSAFKSNFEMYGYKTEAIIPTFFPNNDDALFMAKFFSESRGTIDKADDEKFQNLLNEVQLNSEYNPENGLEIRELDKKDIPGMIHVFEKVFETYPFPIHDPSYLNEVMDSHVRFWGTFKNKKLIGLSSAEMDEETRSAEMTDFAVLPESRGMRIAYHLLNHMESALKEEDFKTVFTIARIKSLPMNKTFLNNGYTFAGTLVNNTNISGDIESMNVHYKKLI